MKTDINTIKGIHPGFVLERELEKRQLRKGQFALSLGEFPQTLTAITKGKRKMNTALALKIENLLGIEEGYFMVLQVYYDIELEKKKQHKTQKNISPNIELLRPILFWDTDMNKIDWQKQKRAIIKRIFERGNDMEKNEITRFYGTETINSILNN
ncbi:plasmid maintenance system antidote protein [Flavobacterium pectinovorum]|uniref:helix-turn-helix transcriptional regulator n=1 Tax=Flavobacterium pectinovorum TaxID=29533 RepID=UPI00265FF914|nr:plasmid maintenance system antidote protein [Flavobacterium pectinovorum]WKL48739.1 plasmid maintenance system antidote protein [Flavobacterium pectinovorum]